jgi:hypothetical protein
MTTTGDRQLTLAGLGPEMDDGFRFTWWNMREGPAVMDRASRTLARWRGGRARAGTRAIAIKTAGFKRLIVAKHYRSLGRRR